jgi:RNA polymerase sigma factor (sigma-70 family)
MTSRSRHKLEELEDAELVRHCVEGDEAALATLVHRYQRLVYSIPFRYGMRPEVAADVFQAVWLRLIEKLPTIKDPQKIASWLITTTVRECWRVSERARRELPIVDESQDGDGPTLHEIADPHPLAEEEQMLIELQHRVRRAVSLLPERCRHLVELLFYSEEPASYAEVARKLGMPVDSVGPTRARCFEKLRRYMGDED